MDEEEFRKNYPFADTIVWCLKCRRKCGVYTSYRRGPAWEDPSPVPCDPYDDEPSFKCCRCGNRDQRRFMVIYVCYADSLEIKMISGYSDFCEKYRQSTLEELSQAGIVTEGWLTRYVPDFNSLTEKRRIFEDRLDDRVIEMAKVIVSDELVGSCPGYITAPGGCRLYYNWEAGKKLLLARAKGLPVVKTDITGLYEEIGKSDTFAKLPPLRECVPMIDREWAAGQMQAEKPE
ncbi:MAG: hypothetical protein IK083_02940 [Abditibacteriota bacterium]|nr:hypothetical protein [Abditibacteriota bacterium]